MVREGIPHPHKGHPCSEKCKEQSRLSLKNKPHPMLDKKHTEESKIKMSNSSPNKGKMPHNFKGGKWLYWRKQTLIRDDYTCQICGLREIGLMDVDHIKPISIYPELKYEINNLVTLCPNCHRRKTNRERKNKIY